MNANQNSTDDLRSAKPLKYAQTIKIDAPMTLLHGGTLSSIDITYETYGKLNANKDNAIVVCHALSGDSHVARHHPNDDPGWWDLAVGSGKAINTDEYFVICANVLGGCRGTTGPNSINPKTGKPYGPDFPVISIEDMLMCKKCSSITLKFKNYFLLSGVRLVACKPSAGRRVTRT